MALFTTCVLGLIFFYFTFFYLLQIMFYETEIFNLLRPLIESLVCSMWYKLLEIGRAGAG